MMHIIPVLDLLGGKVVHAKHGNRDSYQAIQSQLTESCEPIEICDTLMSLYPFKLIYIADIDRIRSNGNHFSCVGEMTRRYPDLKIWLDAGCKNIDDLKKISQLGALPVIGSESLHNLSDYDRMMGTQVPFVLSLDFKDGTFLGPAALIKQPEIWPETIIAMSMSKVGSESGIDQDLLREIRTSASNNRVYAAGGVRSMADIEFAKQLGCAGALVATALHQKNIEPRHIATLHKK